MLSALRLLLASLALSPLAAMACSPKESPSDEQRFAQARNVLVVHVVQIKEGPTNPPLRQSPEPLTVVDFRVIEVLKGKPPAKNRVYDTVGGLCSMPLSVGLDYILFLPDRKDHVLGLFDSSPLLDAKSPAATELIGKLRRLHGMTR